MLDVLSSPLIPLLTFFLGLLIGHRLALGRDRRNDYNRALEPIAEWLHRERANPSESVLPRGAIPDRLRALMGTVQRRRWDAAWQQLEQARHQYWLRDSSGDPRQPSDGIRAVHAAIDHCLAVAHWR